MDTKRILEKARADAGDRAKVRRTARYIVRDLRTRDIDTLAESRRYVAQTADAVGTDTFANVYLTALGDVLAAFEAQLSDDLERAADARIAERPGVASVLRALDRGVSLPSELARELGKERYQVTRLLDALRDEGLVEVRSPAKDKRQRPHYLTARGDAVVASLPEVDAEKDARDVFRDLLLFDVKEFQGQQVPAFAKEFADRVVANCVVPQGTGHNLTVKMESASALMDQCRLDLRAGHGIALDAAAAAVENYDRAAPPSMTLAEPLRSSAPMPSAAGSSRKKNAGLQNHSRDTGDDT